MRIHPWIAGPLLAVVPLLSAAPADQPLPGSPSILPAETKEDTVLPLKIPGYELRALDQRKSVLLNVNGTWVQAALPVFFYFPTPMAPQAAPLLRQIYDDLLTLGRKPEWTAGELQGVLASLDAAIRLLEQPAQDPRPKPKLENPGQAPN